MFGVIFGTICLVALFATVRHRHYGYALGAPFGFRRHGHYGHPPWAVRFARERRRWFLRSLFERLDTTPGQEKVIMKGIDALSMQMETGRRELRQVRRQVAQAVGSEVLDEAVLGAALERVEDLMAKTKLELTQALTEVHAALDGEQRRQLSELIAEGPHGRDFSSSRGGWE